MTIGLCWKGHYEIGEGFQVGLLIPAFVPVLFNKGNDTKIRAC